MRVLLATLLVLSVASPVLATVPQPLPAGHIPPVTLPDHNFTPLPHVLMIPDNSGPMTLERIENAHLSGPIYYALKRLLNPQVSLTALRGRASVSPSSTVGSTTTSFSRFIPVPLLTASQAVNVTDGWSRTADQDAEPAVTALDRTVNQITYTHTITAAMTYAAGTSVGTIFAHSSSSVPPANFTHTELPIPLDVNGNPEYSNTGDPLLATNPYSSGVWPKRVYCTGMLFNAFGNGPFYLLALSGCGIPMMAASRGHCRAALPGKTAVG
jgi:hypothetical protein